jgi:hypothetical protein
MPPAMMRSASTVELPTRSGVGVAWPNPVQTPSLRKKRKGRSVDKVSPEKVRQINRVIKFMVDEFKRVGYVQRDEDAPKSFPKEGDERG